MPGHLLPGPARQLRLAAGLLTHSVAQLLNQGYTIFPDTMGGCHGEIAHIDLTNGSEVFRVLLERGVCWRHNDDGFDGEVVTLTVGKAAPDTRIRGNWDGTIWNGKLEPRFQIKRAELRTRGDGWYTELAEADRHANLKYKYGNRHFWARGYYVETVGRNKKQIQEYIRNQLQEDQIEDQISLKEFVDPFTGSVNKRAYSSLRLRRRF